MTKHHIIRNQSSSLALAALLMGGLAVTASAQNRPMPRLAPERNYTIAPDFQTPMVLNTEPDAECRLHAAGVLDAARTMMLNANGDGYIRVHLTAKPESQDTYLQLDCSTASAVTVYPIHLHTGSSPTDDMPAPESSMPTPKDARVLPALTEEAAQQLSDSDVITLGYPPRPDAATAPVQYAKWLDMVARPMTILTAHPKSRSDVFHQPLGVEAITAETTSNWSGYELRAASLTFSNASGNWLVPPISVGEKGNNTYSSLWVGLDGDSSGDKAAASDLVQAGTESDSSDFGGVLATNYYAWTELVPIQPTVQEQFTLNPGNNMFVHIWIGDSSGNVNVYGGYAWFFVYDQSQNQGVQVSVQLDVFYGREAEWIMERPTIGGGLPELSHYAYALVSNAWVLDNVTGKWLLSSDASRRINMVENYTPHPDDNVLSTAALMGASSINFTWADFH